jgi:hypothetical protein
MTVHRNGDPALVPGRQGRQLGRRCGLAVGDESLTERRNELAAGAMMDLRPTLNPAAAVEVHLRLSGDNTAGRRGGVSGWSMPLIIKHVVEA